MERHFWVETPKQQEEVSTVSPNLFYPRVRNNVPGTVLVFLPLLKFFAPVCIDSMAFVSSQVVSGLKSSHFGLRWFVVPRLSFDVF